MRIVSLLLEGILVYIVGSGEFCLIWSRTMSLRFREGNKVALLRGTEGDSEAVLLAEYTIANLYNATEEKVKTMNLVYFVHLVIRDTLRKRGWIVFSISSLTTIMLANHYVKIWFECTILVLDILVQLGRRFCFIR